MPAPTRPRTRTRRPRDSATRHRRVSRTAAPRRSRPAQRRLWPGKATRAAKSLSLTIGKNPNTLTALCCLCGAQASPRVLTFGSRPLRTSTLKPDAAGANGGRRGPYPSGTYNRLMVELALSSVGGSRTSKPWTTPSLPPLLTSSRRATVARHSGGLTVEMDGMMETLKAFRGLDADLRSETNKELRAAAKDCATGLAGQLGCGRLELRCAGGAARGALHPGQVRPHPGCVYWRRHEGRDRQARTRRRAGLGLGARTEKRPEPVCGRPHIGRLLDRADNGALFRGSGAWTSTGAPSMTFSRPTDWSSGRTRQHPYQDRRGRRPSRPRARHRGQGGWLNDVHVARRWVPPSKRRRCRPPPRSARSAMRPSARPRRRWRTPPRRDKLAGVLKRTTGATAEQVKATEDWIGSLSRATGVADDELRPAMETLGYRHR